MTDLIPPKAPETAMTEAEYIIAYLREFARLAPSHGVEDSLTLAHTAYAESPGRSPHEAALQGARG